MDKHNFRRYRSYPRPDSETDWPRHWPHGRRFLFFRLAGLFGFMALLVLLGMGALAFLLTRRFGGDGPTAVLVWWGGCGLALVMPLSAVFLAWRAFRGIAAEDLPYIFDRFWRGDRSRSHAAGAGAGLGLAIAQQLIQAHSGRITAESEPGRGTTFTIELPPPAA